MLENLLAQGCQAVLNLAAAAFFANEPGPGQSMDVFADRLASHGDPFPDLPKRQPGFGLEQLENLNPAVVGHALEYSLQLPAN